MSVRDGGASRDAGESGNLEGRGDFGSDVPREEQPRLLDLVREEIRVRRYSLPTEEAYVQWIRRFILFHDKRHPLQLREKDVGRFLSHLAVERHVSPSTQNEALNAIVFLYREVLDRELGEVENLVRARKRLRLPVVFTPPEVEAALARLDDMQWRQASLMYGSGLRLMECMRLRLKDLDFGRLEICVRDGKGRRDRVTMLPERLLGPLRAQLEYAEGRHAPAPGRRKGRFRGSAARRGREWSSLAGAPGTRAHRACRAECESRRARAGAHARSVPWPASAQRAREGPERD